MALTNMRTEHKENDTMLSDCTPCCDDKPAYPYGLSLYLNEDSLKKLAMNGAPPVGTKMMLTAMVEITSVSVNETAKEGTRRDVGLQITDMDLGEVKAGPSMAERIYAPQ